MCGKNTYTRRLRTSALSLCFLLDYLPDICGVGLPTEKQIYTILNEYCNLVTGCLKNTPLKIYQFAGIAQPNILQEVIADWERIKARTNKRHP